MKPPTPRTSIPHNSTPVLKQTSTLALKAAVTLSLSIPIAMPSPAFLTCRISISTFIQSRFSTRLYLIYSPFSSLCKGTIFSHPKIKPPVPKKIPCKVSAHGRTWEDPYRWMSNSDDPDLINHLNKENLYAEAFMSDTQNLQKKLLSEMISRMPPKISTPPERWGPWLYRQFIPEGKEYPVLCRQLETHNDGLVGKLLDYVTRGYANEQILLDWNEIAEQYGYVHIGTCRVSPDHNFLAYTLDTTGGEEFMLQIKDLRTGSVIPNSRVDSVVSLAWAKDSQSLLYTVSNETQRPHRVFCTKLGSDVSDAVPIFTENDPTFCVDITSTKDCEFITINSNSRSTSEEGLSSRCK